MWELTETQVVARKLQKCCPQWPTVADYTKNELILDEQTFIFDCRETESASGPSTRHLVDQTWLVCTLEAFRTKAQLGPDASWMFDSLYNPVHCSSAVHDTIRLYLAWVHSRQYDNSQNTSFSYFSLMYSKFSAVYFR